MPVAGSAWSCGPGPRTLPVGPSGDGASGRNVRRRGSECPVGVPLRLLIQAGYELDVQDHDGWTPLHAAAHWGVKEACSILAEALCDMDVRNKLVSRPEPLRAAPLGRTAQGVCGEAQLAARGKGEVTSPAALVPPAPRRQSPTDLASDCPVAPREQAGGTVCVSPWPR